jgi:hypothetical protein
VRTPPEELVNAASVAPEGAVWRSRANQPDPAFPQSPGIILKWTTLILTAAARFVLSMNCKESSRKIIFAHKLICTAYSPDNRGKPDKNDPNRLQKHGIFTPRSKIIHRRPGGKPAAVNKFQK